MENWSIRVFLRVTVDIHYYLTWSLSAAVNSKEGFRWLGLRIPAQMGQPVTPFRGRADNARNRVLTRRYTHPSTVDVQLEDPVAHTHPSFYDDIPAFW